MQMSPISFSNVKLIVPEVFFLSCVINAMAVVPVLTFFVAMWLLAFSFMKAGKLVNYISAPVMGGFITMIAADVKQKAIGLMLRSVCNLPKRNSMIISSIVADIEKMKGSIPATR